MARLHTSGYEIDGTNSTSPDFNSGGGTVTRDTSVFRSGAASAKCDSTGSNTASRFNFANQGTFTSTALPTLVSSTYFIRAYMRFDNAPGSTVRVLDVANNGSAGANAVSARLTTGGKLQLFNNVAGTQIGSDSVATLNMAGTTWYRIEIKIVTNGSSQVTACELQLDGTSVASTTGLTLAAQSIVTVGWCTAPGASKVCYVDDLAINDGTGSVNNSWPGDGAVVLLEPISDSAVGSGWTDDAGSGTNIFDAVANTPPQGIADTTGSTGLHQIRNASSATASYDANMTTYATAGVGGSDTINAVVPFITHGAPVSTGAKTGSVGVASNPNIANIGLTNGVSTDFWTGTAAGTFLSGWVWTAGTITEQPTVTVGTSPVMRVTITGGTASRIAMVCAMFMYVDYTPAAAATNVFDRQQGSLHTDPFSLQVISFAGQRSNVY